MGDKELYKNLSVERTFTTTSDVGQLQDASVGWDQEYYQMTAGPLESSLDLLQVGQKQIAREKWNRKIVYRGTGMPGCFSAALVLKQAEPAVLFGEKIKTGSIVVQPPSREAELIGSTNWDGVNLAVPFSEARSLALNLTGDDLDFDDIPPVSSLTQQARKRLGLAAQDLLRRSKQANEFETKHLLDQFTKLFLWELISSQASKSASLQSCRSAAIVSRACDIAYSDDVCSVGLVELCSEIGVSLRTLHYAFRDCIGISPATWLRRIRLNKVHKTLSASSVGEVQIKGVAIENGFFHQGHFAQQYKRVFGCLPEETLGRH
ncbi:AraC family transcriptional regulator [Ruegeria lacuscaerulensis]|uniref:AraC family transcriptional regulator n=1 Tax=Ruegeria lacuscaerulensis TaxID=55218 RepID=UPI00147F254F|nr:AraC family transcriptional regulator [Ruegeria lacuscaerulensis]